MHIWKNMGVLHSEAIWNISTYLQKVFYESDDQEPIL